MSNSYPAMIPSDSDAPTRPNLTRRADPLSYYQPVRVPRPAARPRRQLSGCGCASLVIFLVLFLSATALYLFFPLRTRVLILGIDRAPDGSFTGRSDTIILMQVDPLRPDLKMLSIPRDLWVPIPGVGENRINTAHFFAEANQKGSGPRAAIQTVEANFGVSIPYYARVRFDGFKEVVDAMGGIDINLAKPMGGLPAGRHHLNGTQALAFARDRKGTDDFFRMVQGQFIFIQAARQLINPLTWPRYPLIAATFLSVVDTNLPAWQWPRLAVALLRAGPDGADHRTLTREMVRPFTTSEGAMVLAPDWDKIHPLVQEMFGR